MTIIHNVLSKEICDIIEKYINYGAWHAHTESLLSFLSSENDIEMWNSWNSWQLWKSRLEYYGFSFYSVKLICKTLTEVIDWISHFEPILTSNLKKETESLLSKLFNMSLAECWGIYKRGCLCFCSCFGIWETLEFYFRSMSLSEICTKAQKEIRFEKDNMNSIWS